MTRWIRLGVSVTTPSPGHITNFKNLEVAWTFRPDSPCGQSRSAPSKRAPCRPSGGFLPEEVIDFTPAIKAEAQKVLSQYTIGPLFTPPITRGYEGKIGRLRSLDHAGLRRRKCECLWITRQRVRPVAGKT